MKITIVTPCRNAARLLPDTLASVAAQSGFDDGEIEHLVMDGASDDDSREVVGRFPHAQFYSEADAGMYDALVKGIRLGTGDVVGYLNAGDVLHPRAFSVLREIFAKPDVRWVTGFSALVNDRLQVVAAWKPPRYREEFIVNGTYLRGHPVPGIMQEATFWSRSLRIDGDRLKRFRLAGDYFIWTELARQAPLHSVESLLGFFRIHRGQLSESKAAYLDEIAPYLRPPTRREKLTAYWEFFCNPILRGPLYRWVLPSSKARIFRYFSDADGWRAT